MMGESQGARQDDQTPGLEPNGFARRVHEFGGKLLELAKECLNHGPQGVCILIVAAIAVALVGSPALLFREPLYGLILLLVGITGLVCCFFWHSHGLSQTRVSNSFRGEREGDQKDALPEPSVPDNCPKTLTPWR